MPLPSIFWVLCFCACQFLYGQGKLYWTDWGTQKVQSANLDGTNVTDLVTGLSSAKGDVALDLQNNKIYWIDRGTGQKELDGSEETIVVELSGGRTGWMLPMGTFITEIIPTIILSEPTWMVLVLSRFYPA